MFTTLRSLVLGTASITMSLLISFPVFAQTYSPKSEHVLPETASTHIVVQKTNGVVLRVPVPVGHSVEDTLERWEGKSSTAYAEMDGLVYAFGQQTSWGYTAVKAAEATTTNGATGSGVVVAVIDTGVDYAHEDLDANAWVNTGETADDGIDNDGNGYIDDRNGYDFIGSMYTSVNPDADPQDEHGHGTHVAGIIAAENNTIGTRGVAPSATVMPLKALDSQGVGFDSTIAEAIRYAVDNGAHIINMSLGSYTASNALRSAVEYAISNDVLVIAAAGNEYTFSLTSLPAGYEGVISVAAEDEDGKKSVYSNWGKVDVIAPGDEILSTTPGNTYTRFTGTSMASPHVAGVAALALDARNSTSGTLARQIIQTTATDFGTQAGPDYLSGYGLVNALAASSAASSNTAYVFADQGFIVSNADDSVSVTVSVYNTAGFPVSGDSIAWSTTKGTLSATSGVTDANGKAVVTLTVDDAAGLAQVTADPGTAAAASIQIAILDDVVQPESIGLMHYSVSEEVSSEEMAKLSSAALTQGGCPDCPVDGEEPAEEAPTEPTMVFSPGDAVVVWSKPFARDREPHTVTMSYAVTDADGTAVEGLSGTTPEATVGDDFYYYYAPQTTLNSAPIDLPDDLLSGAYTITVTITDTESGETSARSTSFWVDETPSVLVVSNMQECSDTPMEGWDFGGYAACSRAGHVLADEIEALGYEVALWDTTAYSSITETDLLEFSIVVWADATLSYPDSYTLQTYLDAGGNLLLTSEVIAANEDAGVPSEFLWNYLHARRVSTLVHPDVVNGVAGGAFADLSFNTDYFDLNGDGARTSFYADELELNDADDAEALLQYTVGDSSEKVAGVRVDSGTYRAAYLSFGLESINDGEGNATKGYVLSTLLDWLQGDELSVTSVKKKTISNNADRTITITGTGFSFTGTTQVKIDSTELSSVTVVDRETIQAVVPAGTAVGRYTVKVIGPDGEKAVLENGLRVVSGGPIVEAVSQNFSSNNAERVITVAGQNFKPKSRVFLGKNRLRTVTFIDPTTLEVTVDAGLKPGRYKLRVKNSSGKADAFARRFFVRYGFTETLRVGSEGTAVRALERRLRDYGYFKRPADTQFTEKTANALRLYQQEKGLKASGETTFLTRVKLNTLK